MYPEEKILMEVGRVTIASGRLDEVLATLWWHMAPDLTDQLKARKKPASTSCDKIRGYARQRLDEVHRQAITTFLDRVVQTVDERNAVAHSRWLLRGRDAMRPVADGLGLDPERRADYARAWEREARESDEWQVQANDSLDLTPATTLEELVRIERDLNALIEAATQWAFRIASMRQTGQPAGWQGPPEARQPDPPIPPGALTGEAADRALVELLVRSQDRTTNP